MGFAEGCPPLTSQVQVTFGPRPCHTNAGLEPHRAADSRKERIRATDGAGILVALWFCVSSGVVPGRADQPPPWLGNSLGRDHSVPPPWTPVKFARDVVSVWGRQYRFDGVVLPSQIVSQKVPMLTRPVSLSAATGDEELQPFSAGKVSVTEQYPDRLVLSGKTVVAEVPLTVRCAVEFDGLMAFTLSVPAAPKQRLKRLALDIPLRDMVGKYYVHDFTGYAPSQLKDMWGTVERNRTFKFMSLSLGNEDVSLTFAAESQKGWLRQRKDRPVQLLRRPGVTLLRVNLFDAWTPVRLAELREISFLLAVMPLRPMRPDFRRYTVMTAWAGEGGPKPFIANGTVPIGVLWPFFPGLSYYEKSIKENPDSARRAVQGESMPTPVDPAAMATWIADFRKLGTLYHVPYTVGNEHTVRDPWFVKYRQEWSATGREITAELLKSDWATDQICGFSDTWADYKVWLLVDQLKRNPYDGFYYDNQAFVPCVSPGHKGHRYRDDEGNEMPIAPHLRFREIYKRIYREAKRLKPDCILLGHGCSPLYPFVDFAIFGEPLLKLAGEQLYTDFVTAEDLRGMFFRGHQMGVPHLLLPEYSPELAGGAANRRAMRSLYSLLWLADVDLWQSWYSPPVSISLWKVKGDFRIWEAEWIPFWRNQVAVPDKEAVKVSVYRRPGNALLAVCNPTNEEQLSVGLVLAWKDLVGPPAIGLAMDAETGEALSVDATKQTLTLSVAACDFRLVGLRAGR